MSSVLNFFLKGSGSTSKINIDEAATKAVKEYPRYQREIESEVSRVRSSNNPMEILGLQVLLTLMVDEKMKPSYTQQLEQLGFRGLLEKNKKFENSPQLALIIGIVAALIGAGIFLALR